MREQILDLEQYPTAISRMKEKKERGRIEHPLFALWGTASRRLFKPRRGGGQGGCNLFYDPSTAKLVQGGAYMGAIRFQAILSHGCASILSRQNLRRFIRN